MKKQSILLLWILTSTWCSLWAQTDVESAQSVVKIKTTRNAVEDGKPVKKLGDATGWCWSEPTLVVTALHAVAGVDKITVRNQDNQTADATLLKVLKEADLALLRLSADLGLKPLQVSETDPNSNQEFYVWGFPHGVHAIQGDPIRFSRSLGLPTLNSILTGNKLKYELQQQGYPLPSVSILRISSIIQPGHSGAPILTNTGKVIGIADGGLRGGTARINWAIPSWKYVPNLPNSADPLPGQSSVQSDLYSASTTVAADADEAEEEQIMESAAKESRVQNGSNSVELTWTAPLSEIFPNLDEETQGSINGLVNDFQVDLSDEEYEVYEDYQTGATFAIPATDNLVVENGWYLSHNDANDQMLYALPYAAGTYNNAVQNLHTMFEHFLARQNWQPVEGTDDSEENLPDEGIYEQVKVRVADDAQGTRWFMILGGRVEGSSLLVVAYIGNFTDIANTPERSHEACKYLTAAFLADYIKN